jgi:hypothetical protein
MKHYEEIDQYTINRNGQYRIKRKKAWNGALDEWTDPVIRLAGIIAVVLVVALSASGAAQTPVGGDFSVALKRFLSYPPAIESISFKMQKADPTADTNGFVHYVGRYQSNGFILCQATPMNKFPPNYFSNEVPGMYTCWGNYEKDFWSIRNKRIQYWYDDGKLAKNEGNPMYMTVLVGKWILAEAVNLGITQIDIGSVKWSGDKFTASRTFPRPESSISGELTSSNGYPVSLLLDYGGFSYTVEYRYSNPLSVPGIPNVAEMFLIKNGAKTKTSHIEITELVVATNVLRAELFSKEQFSGVSVADESKAKISDQEPATLIYTNNQRIAVDGTNRRVMPAPYQIGLFRNVPAVFH